MATAPAIAAPQESSLLASLRGSASKLDESTALASQDRFLTLLTTQIRNQDPLNPMDNAQMTSQLAQISTVDGIERLNKTLEALMANANDNQALQAAALVGHGVLVPGKELALTDGMALGGVDLAEAADRVAVTIKDSNGLTIRTLDLGQQDAGSQLFRWDGASDNGATAANGAYTVSVNAVRGDTTVSAEALQLGVVSSVVRAGGGITLNVGESGVYKLSDVKQIL
ncbi:MAG TPA: flagellar hook assembly protein FlgD [Acidiferrobacterales bacterium]|nr:flagellar hook assembly protein FlgD [Acidiferrobacterales bacterium]